MATLKYYNQTTSQWEAIPGGSVSGTDVRVFSDASGGNATVPLPTAVGFEGTYTVKKIDVSTNTVTMATINGETIDGSTTVDITSQYESITIASNGTNWFII